MLPADPPLLNPTVPSTRAQRKEVHNMNERTYWNSNGPEQAKYDEMEVAGF